MRHRAGRALARCRGAFGPLQAAAAVSLSIVAASAPAAAEDAPVPARADVRDEAHERFDRGLRLFNQGDNAGALAEFLRAHELVPHPLVLYNIGLVHAAMGDPVAAVEALDRLLAAPGALSPERAQRARSVRAEQALRIAELEVVAPVAPATLSIDGIEVGAAPFDAPLRVASGQHLLTLVAPGHAPSRKTITVAGQTRTRVTFELVPLASALARLSVEASIAGADVFVNGERVGVTPLAAPLTLPPGTHRVELRRRGYRTVSEHVVLGPAADGKLVATPATDPGLLAREGGELWLSISEPGASVFVDGASVRASTALRLPLGPHRLRVEHARFLVFEREVQVEAGRRTQVEVELEPTPAERDRYRTATRRVRTLAWVGVGAGSALAAGAAGFLVWNHGAKSDAQRDVDQQFARWEDGGDCDRSTGPARECQTALTLAIEDLDTAQGRDVYGVIGLGAGAALLGTGLLLLVLGDDPDRYEPTPESDVFGRLRLMPWLGPGRGVSAGLSF